MIYAAMASASIDPRAEPHEKQAFGLLGRGLLAAGKGLANFGAKKGIPSWIGGMGTKLMRGGVAARGMGAGWRGAAGAAGGAAGRGAAGAAGQSYAWGPLGMMNKFLDGRTGITRALTAPMRWMAPKTYRGAAGMGVGFGAIADRANEGQRMQDAGNYATARTLQELRGNPLMALGAAFGGPETVAGRLAERGFGGAAEHYMRMNTVPGYTDGYRNSLAAQAYVPGLSSIVN